jgi:hypothetical protein
VDKAGLESSLNALDVWLIIFGVFVAIGVVGESITGFLHWRRSGQLQSVQTAENLAQQKEIARLSNETASARGGIAEANARAADANARALQAQVELAKFKAPRTLTQEQQDRITSKLSAFSGTQFDAAVGPIGDPEPELLLRVIETTLEKAGWAQIDWKGAKMQLATPGKKIAGLSSVTNVIVEADPPLAQATFELAAALNAEGIAALAQGSSNDATANTNTVHIMIGRKM